MASACKASLAREPVLHRYLDVEPGYDMLTITDLVTGANLTEPLSRAASFSSYGPPDMINITSNAFAVRFTSDASVNYIGFALEYYVTNGSLVLPPPVPPPSSGGWGGYSPAGGYGSGYNGSGYPGPGSGAYWGPGSNAAGSYNFTAYQDQPQCDSLFVVQGSGYYTNSSEGGYITSDYRTRRAAFNVSSADGASAPPQMPPLPGTSPYMWLPLYRPNTTCTWQFNLPAGSYATLSFE